MIKLAIPLVHVSDSAAAEDFYCKRLGFRREFTKRGDDSKPDPCFMGLTRDGVWVHVSSFSGDGVSGGVVGLTTAGVQVEGENSRLLKSQVS